MILLLETSAAICSVSLANTSGESIDTLRSEMPNSHAEKLPVMVQELLHRNQLSVSELRAIGINSGPGSYTGLRIGTSLAKGMCYAAKLPLLGLNGLLAMAEEIRNNGTVADIFMSALDARRDELYLQVFDGNLNEVEPLKAIQVNIGFFDMYRGKQIVFVSNTNTKVQSLSGVTEGVAFVDSEPEAAYLRWQAAHQFAANSFEDLAYFEPKYLKDFVPGISKKFSM